MSGVGCCGDCRPLRSEAQRGEHNPAAKLNEDQVRAIRRRYARGESSVKLGRLFGVTHKNVLLIVHRKRWRHVA